jgi:predicted LPLAT superfamily acyltransferase
LLATLARGVGRAPVRFLLLFIVLYYALLKPVVRRSSRDYLKRIGEPCGFWAVYRHLLCFAQCALDRLYFLSGDMKRFQIRRREGHEYLADLSARKQGAILLGAHVGSFEAARALERSSDDVSIHALGYFGNARMLNRELDRAGDNSNRQFVSLQPGELQHLFQVKELIEAGHLVAMLGDRSTGGQSVEVEFLGGRARFPIGPYAMAAALQCPVLLTIGLYFSPNSYEVYCEPFMTRVPKRREDPEGFVKCAQAFAQRLELYCRRAPNNWFNFYDFWDEHGVS